MKKIVTLLLILSILLGNVSQMSGYANAAGAAVSDLLTENKPSLETDDLVPLVSKSTNDAVSEILSAMTVTQDTYSKSLRGRYLVSLKKDYPVSVSSVVYSVYAETSEPGLTNSTVNLSPFAEMRKQQYNQDLAQKVNLYHVKDLESANALYMELHPEEVNQLLANPMVAAVEEDKAIQIAEEKALTQVEEQPIKESSQTIPWGIHSTGSYITRQAEGSGERRIKVAVFDTGISSHPDLNIAGGVSYVDTSPGYADDKGHGTHIAGTIAALDNSFGVVGAAPDAEIYAVKVADSSGDGYTSSVIQGIEWAIDHDINIINMSFVSAQYSELLHKAIRKANSAGIIIVAAAGNNGSGEDTLQYPAKYPEVVAVGAIESSHHRTDFSATGDELDLVAPGFGVMSTTMNGGYGVSSGTSNAAAHVTGAAALLWAHHPSLSGQQVIEKLYVTATPLDTSHESGHGIINIAKAEGVITGSIAPLSEENLSGLNTIIPSLPDSEIGIASYDHKNDGATIHPGDKVTVSLKLEGDEHGENPHQRVEVEVTSASNPLQVITSKTITGVELDKDIPYTWQTSSSTPTGTYNIKYKFPAVPSGVYDYRFTVFVTEAGLGQDTFEPNDTFITAKNVFPENSYISYISSASDVDYYKLTAEETGQIPIGLTIPSTVDYELDIYNASGLPVWSSSNGTGAAEHVDLQITKNKVYYLKVTGFSGQFSSSPYTLILGAIEAQPFAVPTGLETAAYANSIKLTWDAMPEAVLYKIRINGVDKGTSNVNSYTFLNLISSQGYLLEVAAVYPAGTSPYASVQASTTLPELIVYQPQDVNQASRSTQLFSFKPATTGVYRIFTSPYQGNGPAVDTELSIYNNLQLNKQLAVNDDTNDTVFSEIRISLIGGQTYYVKVNGFDTTALRTRITADVISSSIPYIQQDHPVDINEQAGNSNVYVFVPASTGKFRINTNRYGGNASSKANDTDLSVFASVDMEEVITGGYNDDKADSMFSEVTVNLSAGVPYYIRVDEVNGGKTYARLLVTSAGQTAFTSLNTGIPIDLSKASGEEAYLQFTPVSTGKYRFFTSNYQATSQLNDTEIALYTDTDLKNLLDSNDDARDYRPYGEHFSKLEVNLTAGMTYYVTVRSFGSINGLQTRFAVEEMEHNTAGSAVNLPFGELVTTDSHGAPLVISSLYDIDYYKIELTAPDQISLYLSEGEGTIEDPHGNIRGYFSAEGQMSFDLDAGTYYLKIQSGWEGPAWGFSKFEYELSADKNNIEYIQGENEFMSTLRALKASAVKSFDATPGNKGSVKVQYKNKVKNTNLKVEIRTANLANGIRVYEYTKEGSFNKDTLTDIFWNGSVDSKSQEKYWYANYTDSISGTPQYWAKDGYYKIFVSRLDGSKKKQTQEFLVQVINDPLNGLNIIPLPPTIEKGKTITANTKPCKSCKNYFERYILHPNDYAYELEYGTWFAEVYGLTGIQKFAAGASKLITCSEGNARKRLQCTLDNVGMIPILGEGADAINGVIYFVNGDYVDALLSAGAIVPIVGNYVTAGKKISYTAAKRVELVYKLNPCGCVPEGTEIITKDGPKPIEQIQIGDIVLAKDTDTGKQAYKPVVNLFSRENTEIYNLEIQGELVQSTGNHPFWVKGKGWITADELTPGDLLERQTGATVELQSVELSNKESRVYNFEVEGFHTFYVSALGLLTHNSIAACELSNYTKVVTYRLSKSKGKPSAILNAELKAATKIIKEPYWEAHHLVPVQVPHEAAQEARDILASVNIDINSSANGVYLPPAKLKTSPSTLSLENGNYLVSTHNTSHGEDYFKFVRNALLPVKNIKDPMEAQLAAIEILNNLRESLLTGQLKIFKELE
ncbi:MAG TPA: S8 family serine peptidase [Paenibacillus sp.]